MQIIAFLMVISILIFVHEFGHFIVAKFFGVKVMKFSIGMGPKLFGFKYGETEYVVAAIPIGGFVSMLGHDPSIEITPEDEGRSLNDKKNWQRFLVMFAGPAFNLLLPFLLYFIFALFETTHLTPMIGQYSVNGPVAKAGLQSGDIITSIDKQPIRYWRDLSRVLESRAGKTMPISYLRDGKRYTATITTTKDENTDKIKIYKYKGRLGITPYFDNAIIFLENDSDYKIKNFDLITEINGEKLKSKKDLFKYKDKETINIKVKRAKRIDYTIFDLFTLEDIELKDVKTQFINELLDSEMAIWWIHPGSVASKLGLKKGDYILSVDNQIFKHWVFLQDYISLKKDKEISIKILRDGKEKSFTFKQRLIKSKHVTEKAYYEFGVVPYVINEGTEITPFIVSKTVLSDAFSEMFYQTTTMTRLVFTAVIQLVTGKLGFEHLGGPIMMYEASGMALQYGWLSLLKLMALLSINLGLLNLLPIPMLDGGHIIFILAEMIRRKPVNQRFKEIASFVGLSILVLVMILVFKNDIENFIFR